jgi:photosystem II stability/assembly factor-like uncharacterized protein
VVNDNVEFHAVASIGADVWAGGTGGALYHSTDAGEHWAKVSFATPSSVVRITFTDPANGEVKTSSGEIWTTQDNGATWKRR